MDTHTDMIYIYIHFELRFFDFTIEFSRSNVPGFNFAAGNFELRKITSFGNFKRQTYNHIFLNFV